jgi:uncharacterized membrane protein YbhN (UPF0104 family)
MTKALPDGAVARGARRRVSVRRTAQAVVGIGLAATLLIWGLPHFAKTTWGDVFAVIARVPIENALLFLALVIGGLWCYTFTLTGSLPGLGHLKALVVNVCGSSVSNLLPGGGAVGLAATYTICRSWGFSRRAVSISAIVTGVWNTLARIILPILAIIALAAGRQDLPHVMQDATVAAVLSGLALIGVFAAVIVSPRAAHLLGAGLDRVVRMLTRRPERTTGLDALVTDLRARTVGVVRSRWHVMTLGMVGFFGVYFVLFVLIMRTTGVELFYGELFAAYAIGRLLTAVGVTPGGVGFTETGTAAALVAWGAAPAEATAGVVLFSIFTQLMEIPLGAIGWVAWSIMPKSPPDATTDAAADVGADSTPQPTRRRT